MCGDDKLYLRECFLQYFQKFPLPSRVQMHFNLINQYNAFGFCRDILHRRVQKDGTICKLQHHTQYCLISCAELINRLLRAAIEIYDSPCSRRIINLRIGGILIYQGDELVDNRLKRFVFCNLLFSLIAGKVHLDAPVLDILHFQVIRKSPYITLCSFCFSNRESHRCAFIPDNLSSSSTEKAEKGHLYLRIANGISKQMMKIIILCFRICGYVFLFLSAMKVFAVHMHIALNHNRIMRNWLDRRIAHLHGSRISILIHHFFGNCSTVRSYPFQRGRKHYCKRSQKCCLPCPIVADQEIDPFMKIHM